MGRQYERPGDFEAVVRILTTREGRRRMPVHNGIKWDFRYFFQGENELSGLTVSSFVFGFRSARTP